MCSKGNNQTTNTSQANPAAMSAYYNVLNRAGALGAQPYDPYTGQLVAGVNPQQMLGISDINQAATSAQPYIQQAAFNVNSALQPFSATAIQQYMNPFTQNVVNTTQNAFDLANRQALSNIKGNEIAQGALGGNRDAVAESAYYQGVAPAQAQTIAGLENTGYNQAVQNWLATNRQQLAGGAELANIGVSGQGAGLAGGQAQVGAGTLQQTTEQAALNAMYQQYLNAQAFPYQQLGFQAALDTGVGSNMGGTSTTQGPQPNTFAQALGAGLGILGSFLSRGGRANGVAGYDRGGGVVGRDPGGVINWNGPYAGANQGVGSQPYSGGNSYIPSVNISHGSGPPKAPSAPSQQQPDYGKMAQGLGNVYQDASADLRNRYGVTDSDVSLGDALFATGDMSDVEFAKGGGVKGYDDGGDVSFDDRWNADIEPLVSSGNLPTIDENADQAWRDTTDQNIGRGQSAQPIGDFPVAPAHGVVPATSTADSGVVPPPFLRPQRPATSALAYSGNDDGDEEPTAVQTSVVPPARTRGVVPSTATGTSGVAPQPGLIDNLLSAVHLPHISPEAKQGLLSAAFALMGNTAGGKGSFGVAIGRAGEAGMRSYSQAQAVSYQAEQDALKLQMELQKMRDTEEQNKMTNLNRYVVLDKNGKPVPNQAYIKASQELQRDYKPTMVELQPADPLLGTPAIKGLFDPNNKERPITPLDQWGRPMDISKLPPQVQETITNASTTPAPTVPPPAVPVPPPAVTPPANTTAPATFDQRFQAATTPPIATPPTVAPTKPQFSPQSDSESQPLWTASPDGTMRPAPKQAETPQPPQPLASWGERSQMEMGDPRARDWDYLNKIAAINPALASEILGIANYNTDPYKLTSLRAKSADRLHLDQMVRKFDPTFQPGEYGQVYAAKTAFLPGKKMGDTVRAFNTAVSHLDVLRELYKELQNKSFTPYNKVANTFKTVFGYAAPNNLAAAGQLVAGEVVKATVGSQNALGDREELNQRVQRDISNGQALGVIDTFQRLMGGQLFSIKKAYEESTHLHNFEKKYLLPRSMEVVKQVEGEGGDPNAAALNWVNDPKNNTPENKAKIRAIKIKLGLVNG